MSGSCIALGSAMVWGSFVSSGDLLSGDSQCCRWVTSGLFIGLVGVEVLLRHPMAFCLGNWVAAPRPHSTQYPPWGLVELCGGEKTVFSNCKTACRVFLILTPRSAFLDVTIYWSTPSLSHALPILTKISTETAPEAR
jgi:hypothetical protein